MLTTARLTAALLTGTVLTGGVALAAPTTSSAAPRVVSAVSTAGEFTPVAPKRILDTRNAIGLSGHFKQGQTRTLKVAGASGSPVPAGQASAVVFNLTVTNPSKSSWITVWPSGQSRPAASNINFPKGWTGANLVTVGLGSGNVNIYNSGGTVDVIADVVGWYTDSSHQGVGHFQTVTPVRLWDSRPSSGLPGVHVPMGGRQTLYQPVDISSGGSSANANIKALVVSLTAVKPSSSGYLTAWSGTGDPPTASVLNYTKKSIVPNLAVVPVAPCDECTGSDHNLPSIAIYNGSSGHTDILIDLWGFYDDGGLANGLDFKALSAPIRIADRTLGTADTAHISAPGSVAGAQTQLLVQNVTSVPAATTWLALWPHGLSRPSVSNLNPVAHRTVAGLAYTGVGTSNDFDVYNSNGSDRVLIDVAGSMEPAGSFKAGAANSAGAANTAGAVRSSWGTTFVAPTLRTG